MEDMARLAMLEQNVKNPEMFSNILHELLLFINYIIENPQENAIRVITNDKLKSACKYDSFKEYLKYLGFEVRNGKFIYPKDQTLNKLKMAQAALERKIYFCLGYIDSSKINLRDKRSLPVLKAPKLYPANILNTHNEFLLTIQSLFNNMLIYEDEELQEYAKQHIPIVTLQLMAIDRMREQQKKIKSGELDKNTKDLPFDLAFLMELLGWFKYSFFKWVDRPQCVSCGGSTIFHRTASLTTDTETCRMEVYQCDQCPDIETQFPRYNNVRTLLKTRRGRCGEWAKCFTLLCRAMRYDTRYIYDTTDHVWCEIFDHEANTWIHVDPCEGKLNAPLMYSHGWKKKLSYVIGLSKDDLQDVTWRYTTDHAEVRARRNLCTESELISAILDLRQHRQNQLSEARRKYLTKRCLEELVQIMVERTPSDYEEHGRISGSIEWRTERGEIGCNSGYVFMFADPGPYVFRYYTGQDKYRVFSGRDEINSMENWSTCVFRRRNVFRKVEYDWNKTYLAREEGSSIGSVCWKIATESKGLKFTTLAIRLTSASFENGDVSWAIEFDDDPPIDAKLGESQMEFVQQYRSAIITAELRGGTGGMAWQHAQIFRQSLESKSSTFEVSLTLEKVEE